MYFPLRAGTPSGSDLCRLCLGVVLPSKSFIPFGSYIPSASSAEFPETWEEEFDGDIPFRSECPKVSHSLHIVQGWVSKFVPVYCRGTLLCWWLCRRLIYKAQQNVIKNNFTACLLFALIFLSFLLLYQFTCMSASHATSLILKTITPILKTHLLVSVIIETWQKKNLKGRIHFLQDFRSFYFFWLGLSFSVFRSRQQNGDRSMSRKRILVGRKQSKQWTWGVEESLLPKHTSPTNWSPAPVQPSSYNTLQ